MGFGRKGLDGAAAGSGASGFGGRPSEIDGNAMPPGMSRALGRGQVRETGQSPELQAFLAAERANRATNVAPEYDEPVERSRPVRTGARREMWLAYVLWWFAGGFAAHRFYLGQVTSAVIMICALIGSFAMMFILPPLGLGCFILWFLWLLADAALIPGMTRRYNESLMTPADAFV
jgi:TM2 domain-containing membrane protein YozV